MKSLPRPSEEAEQYIRRGGLAHTDLRYSFGVSGVVVDAVQFDSGGNGHDQYRRLLVCDRDSVESTQKLWDTANSTDRHYITPRLFDEKGNLVIYQIPLSARPFKYEVSLSEDARNDIDNLKIAESLGFLLSRTYIDHGLIMKNDSLLDRLMIIDFVTSDIEPIMLAPPVEIDYSLDIDGYYVDAFDISTNRFMRGVIKNEINEQHGSI